MSDSTVREQLPKHHWTVFTPNFPQTKNHPIVRIVFSWGNANYQRYEFCSLTLGMLPWETTMSDYQECFHHGPNIIGKQRYHLQTYYSGSKHSKHCVVRPTIIVWLPRRTQNILQWTLQWWGYFRKTKTAETIPSQKQTFDTKPTTLEQLVVFSL